MSSKKIFKLSTSDIIGAYSYIYDKYLSLHSLMARIYASIESLDRDIDVDSRGIQAYVGDGVYNRQNKVFEFQESKKLISTGVEVSLLKSASSAISDSEIVLFSDEASKGERVLTSYFLSKKAKTYSVFWFYDKTKINMDVTALSKTVDIPSFEMCSPLFYLKIGEAFLELRGINTDTTEKNSIVTNKVCFGELNRIESNIVICNPISLTGSSFTYKRGVLKLNNVASVIGNSVSIRNKNSVSPHSLVPKEVIEKVLIKADLSNIKTLTVSSTDPLREDSVVLSSFAESMVPSFFGVNTAEVPYQTEVKSLSNGSSACNVQAFIELLKNKLSVYYVDSIIKVVNGETLSDEDKIIAYIDEKIKELNNLYVNMLDCSDAELNTVGNNGECHSICENVSDSNQMLTKKMLIECFKKKISC